jgi:hypothetical protein
MSLKVTRLQLTQPLKSPTAFSRLNDSRGNARGKKYGVLHDKRNNTCKCGENVFFFLKKKSIFSSNWIGASCIALQGGRGVHCCIFFSVYFSMFFMLYFGIVIVMIVAKKTMLNKRCPCDQTPYRLFVISGLFIILLKNGKSLL